MDTLWQLDLQNLNDLEKDRTGTASKSCQWLPVPTSGQSPGPITNHTSVVIGDMMYLYGETEGKLYSLNLATFEWKIVKTSGDDPGSLSEHTAVGPY